MKKIRFEVNTTVQKYYNNIPVLSNTIYENNLSAMSKFYSMPSFIAKIEKVFIELPMIKGIKITHKEVENIANTRHIYFSYLFIPEFEKDNILTKKEKKEIENKLNLIIDLNEKDVHFENKDDLLRSAKRLGLTLLTQKNMKGDTKNRIKAYEKMLYEIDDYSLSEDYKEELNLFLKGKPPLIHIKINGEEIPVFDVKNTYGKIIHDTKNALPLLNKKQNVINLMKIFEEKDANIIYINKLTLSCMAYEKSDELFTYPDDKKDEGQLLIKNMIKLYNKDVDFIDKLFLNSSIDEKKELNNFFGQIKAEIRLKEKEILSGNIESININAPNTKPRI